MAYFPNPLRERASGERENNKKKDFEGQQTQQRDAMTSIL